MNHLTDIELERGDRQRIIAHIAECAACARLYAAAIRNRPLDAEPAAATEEFARAGRSFARPRNRWVAPLAAAAVLMIVIAIPLMRRQPNPQIHLRGTAITAFERDGQLAWSSGIAAPKYRVEISNGFRVETDRTRIAVPPLTPGTYTWTVTALDAEGRAIATSPPQSLTIAK
ncbi:MAG TPA: hypothetical protein VL284_09255 [Thermoanaerobaculia bacterium]|nr:hypothetical protein [Thermoanaerobaculia bacterium]